MRLLYCCAVWAFIDVSNGISTKMDFGAEESTYDVTNSSTIEDDDVEVKHTIVVSTKLKNNNRRGLHSEGDTGTLSYNVGQRSKPKEDSGEVPIFKGYKSVETTAIRTPDTRNKAENIYPDAIFVNRNIRDDYDTYPNAAANPMQWKPSNFYNNINWYNQGGGDPRNLDRRNRPNYQNPGKLNRKITDDGMKEFYCRKCIELSNAQGFKCPGAVVHPRSASPWLYETTTPKIKIDGKLTKLN